MAINAYTGLMGSGKSFEVVSSVIVPAVLQGRRVVTNIDGINPEAIYRYCEEVKKADCAKLGSVIGVTNEDVTKPGFFPDETKPDQSSVVQPGDLVAIDECWQFWGNEHKISEEHMRFFRMHRHYTDPSSGVTCDLALMIQDLGTLNRKIRAVIELTTRTVKLKSIGAPTAYRIELYEGNKTTNKAKIDTFVKKYDKAIFPLYKSYAGGSGNEKPIDRRQNVLTNPRLWFLGGAVLLMFVVGGYFTYRFFKPPPPPSRGNAAAPAQGAVPKVAKAQPDGPQGGFSEDWRYSGHFTGQSGSWAVVVDSSGRIRLESPSAFTGTGFAAVGQVDGQTVTRYSGSRETFLEQPGTASK
ncbi:zonular occludens toxin family protein [Hydrogenophaga sp. NFH-34]|uniref:zonular occludens toxin family protein n=1 Tax=Hydrogenophaga sp. NFH-34 TaxID=2744446 RepID=UPI001F27F482|nr:zonular occludens toxin domain-containing protein [Hydrogenophaga sp. NFH-34]